jgi:cytochrome c-type biogenesis protein CcmH/NrfG
VHKESLLFGVAGIFFGLVVGWVIGSQQPSPPRVSAAAPSAQSAQAPDGQQQGQAAVPLDETRAAQLRAAAERNPADAATRVQLGNMYFDAGRFQDATRWYEDALRADPRNPDVSTDLGIAYYYTNQPDRALQQFEHSLRMDPKHSKTLLNIGVVRAFGKQDLKGAADAWQQVVDLAPDTPEARAARQALEGLRNAHPDSGGGTTPPGKPPVNPE